MPIDRNAFERIAAQECAHVPERFARRIENLALLVEDEPSHETLAAEGIPPGETLLGLYHGVPATGRGDFYSGVLPDTITLYRLPLMEEAEALLAAGRAVTHKEAVRLAVRETLWHEIGHYFGLDDDAIHRREDEGTNEFQ